MPFPFLISLIAGCACAGAFTSLAVLFKKFVDDVKESDKDSYSLREISKEINLPEYTIRRYISLNKLKAESSTDSENPRKSGYKVSKDALLDFLVNNEDELIKSMDKVQRKNIESKSESNKDISQDNIMDYSGELENSLSLSIDSSSIEELDIAIKVIKRYIESINLDIEEIYLNDGSELTIEQKKAIIQKKKEIIKFENIISMYEMRKLELSKNDHK